MPTLQQIGNHLIKNSTPVSRVTSYSELPGIYALFFIGEKFPLEHYILPKNKLIYIGKTESSQRSRDANTHFKTGRTGSSTVRKSIGALLSQTQKITPIIRSVSDIEKGRISHFKFDDQSEIKVTQWMMDNLAVSFYEYPQSKQEIDKLETVLIQFFNPMLNIDAKSVNNPYKIEIKALRKRLGLQAHSSYQGVVVSQKKKPLVKQAVPRLNSSFVSSTGKYSQVWTQYLIDIQKAIKTSGTSYLKLSKQPFQSVGNRKSYSFRLDYRNNQVTNNIGGSAVARDLDKVLKTNKIHVGSRTFRLTRDFELIIE